ncbi:MAG: FMN-dependent NADH-azoreductase [Bosea sp. (in: a-proteobacteria)]|jgi:FMN-dependent NADH-azoreductase|uniref:FMN-dependent NADH-azoreductase n=1 Tax=Bosea sp. (in: a-proteobacteria) TaxID=1871050 RepID=UPI000B00D08C|nr:FMN-dependent NADH-azoreductase [Bosea sp. (in: a-proteobacteria)]MBA4336055.1 FMN-dependent NADH-azoreductase [Methylobacterium sp.]MDP3600825.1 FMN-dependent NADH-azoreductase [Bosea sp. (in: a-proteobacteria)]
MSHLLVINSSAAGAASVSKQLIDETVARLRTADPALVVVERDLGANPVPHLTTDSTAAIRGAEPANDAQRAAKALSDSLVAELKAADTLIIGAPMYNFGIPSTLKSWFDHVLRAGVTFKYGEKGPVGLLEGKRAIVVESRGGIYSSGPTQALDSQEPHLRTMLGFIGISDVTFVRAEKLGYGPEAREQAINDAKAELARVA